MASSNYDCSIRSAFSFDKDDQELIGHVTALTIGGTALAADFTFTDPITGTQTIKAVGAIAEASWEGGYADPLYVSMQVSGSNKKLVRARLGTDIASAAVLITFTVYAFDPHAKTYYKAFWTHDQNLNGLLLTQGGEVALQIATEQSMEVPSPKNFTLSLGVMPAEGQQAIQLAVSNTDMFSKQWGVSVGA